MIRYKCALIAVSDLQQSLYFYRDLLGQEIEFDFGENISFKSGFALHQASHFSTLTGREVGKSNYAFELYFESDDLEDLSAKLNNDGVAFVHQIREQPWRQKVMRFLDPDQNIVEIGESMEHLCYRLFTEGLSLETIAQVSNMSLDFVNKSINDFIPKQIK
jgi:catechol 2,3-dioxygenase-like lactoylglutathione lyase family enzyme